MPIGTRALLALLAPPLAGQEAFSTGLAVGFGTEAGSPERPLVVLRAAVRI